MNFITDRIIVILCLMIISYLLGVVFASESGDYLKHIGLVTAMATGVGAFFITVSAISRKFNKELLYKVSTGVYRVVVLGAIGYIIFWFSPACAC